MKLRLQITYFRIFGHFVGGGLGLGLGGRYQHIHGRKFKQNLNKKGLL